MPHDSDLRANADATVALEALTRRSDADMKRELGGRKAAAALSQFASWADRRRQTYSRISEWC